MSNIINVLNVKCITLENDPLFKLHTLKQSKEGIKEDYFTYEFQKENAIKGFSLLYIKNDMTPKQIYEYFTSK